jgi:aminomethyltransferase
MSHPERTAPPSPMQHTALYALHVANTANGSISRIRDAVPIPLGVMKEHLYTRKYAGIFDVSHMGQITVRSRLADK